MSADLQELCNAELVSPAPAELLLPGRDDYVDKWDGLVEDLFPQNSHGRAWLTFYLLPHSVTIACTSLDGQLYLWANDPEEKRWVDMETVK